MTWLLTTVQQGLLFFATVLMIGCTVWRIFVAPRAQSALSEEPAVEIGSAESDVLRWARVTAVALVAAWLLRMVVQVMAFRDPFAPLSEDVSLLLFQTTWGTVWMAQGGVVLGLLGTLLAWARVGSRDEVRGTHLHMTPAWTAVTLLTAGLAATLAMSGHAMGAETWRAAAVTADALHTVAAGAWIGTLAVILLLARRGDVDPDPATFGAQIRHFSPVALVAGGVLVAMGGALSWTHLTAVSDLWQAGYGRVLSGKIALVLVILGLGFRNWRAGVPVSDQPEGVREIRRRGGWEVALASAVIVLTAVLVHSIKP